MHRSQNSVRHELNAQQRLATYRHKINFRNPSYNSSFVKITITVRILKVQKSA